VPTCLLPALLPVVCEEDCVCSIVAKCGGGPGSLPYRLTLQVGGAGGDECSMIPGGAGGGADDH